MKIINASYENSEVCPEGTSCIFEVQCAIDDDAKMLKEWLNYAKFKGIGQWRNSGKGRFTYEILEERTESLM